MDRNESVLPCCSSPPFGWGLRSDGAGRAIRPPRVVFGAEPTDAQVLPVAAGKLAPAALHRRGGGGDAQSPSRQSQAAPAGGRKGRPDRRSVHQGTAGPLPGSGKRRGWSAVPGARPKRRRNRRNNSGSGSRKKARKSGAVIETAPLCMGMRSGLAAGLWEDSRSQPSPWIRVRDTVLYTRKVITELMPA